MSDLVQRLAEVRRDVAELKRGRVTNRAVTVTATNPGTSTFSAALPDGQSLTGLTSPAEFLPATGQTVTLSLEGATPIYQPAQISGMTAGKLTNGTVSADVTIAGRFATALTGARVELNALGLQKWDTAGNLMVSVTGTTNLITGTYQTALTGRRVEVGASGNVGRVTFYSATTTSGVLESYTDPATSIEAIRQVVPIASSWPGWNGFQAQSNENAHLSSANVTVTFGGATSAGTFRVSYAADNGTATSQPTRDDRLLIDDTTHRMFVGAVATEGSIDIVRHGVADTRNRSPRIQLRAEGGTQASNLKYVIEGDGTLPRIEVTNTADTGYGAIWASAFTVSSSGRGKDRIADLSGSALDRVRAMRPRTYRRIAKDTDPGPVEIGLIAEESPAEVVVGDFEAVNLYALAVLNTGAIQEVDARLTALDVRLSALTKRAGVP